MSRHTLACAVEHHTEIKHSRFIARAAPVQTAQQALDWLAQVSDIQATHNCWAWRIGNDYRSNDDGEPSGTAGRPILAAIDGQGFDEVMVVVTRYYGGIKLGAGGLVRAYGGSAAEALRNAPRVALVAMATVQIDADFAQIGHVHALLHDARIEKTAEHFDSDGVHLQLRLPADGVADLQQRLRDATRNQAHLQVLDNCA